ncbi:MAG: FadR family transcriptional regulator [Treponema sp.]|nr:FadR family transcriptional regulator [Treponema sp.]
MYQTEKMGEKLLASRVEDELMNYILRTPVNIGERIPNEFELAQLFGVGRSTIRETVKSLATKGILEVRRGAGTYVVSTSSIEDDPLGLSKFKDKFELALELFDIRLMIEPDTAALASAYISEEDKIELKRLCDTVEELYEAGKDHTKEDIEFHMHIMHCSKNRVLEMLRPIVQASIVTLINLTRYRLKNETIQTHRAITDAIVNGDAVGAKCAVITHLTFNRQTILRLMNEQNKKAKTSDVMLQK